LYGQYVPFVVVVEGINTFVVVATGLVEVVVVATVVDVVKSEVVVFIGVVVVRTGVCGIVVVPEYLL
jgi:hypothetical protein